MLRSIGFKIKAKSLILGEWRPVTLNGKMGVRKSLLGASDDPTLDTPENLKTGISASERIYVMPLSWFQLSMYQNRCRFWGFWQTYRSFSH